MGSINALPNYVEYYGLPKKGNANTGASTPLPNLHRVNPYYRSPFESIVLVPSFVI
jgi:hypothetical protein